MRITKKADRRIIVWAGLIELSYLLIVTYTCQWFIFRNDLRDVALSVLIGTCMTLVGALAALLASPYGAEDEKRLSRVSATIITLLTGYALAKIIDPLVAKLMDDKAALSDIRTWTFIIIGLIGFLGGFLGTYVFRVYLASPSDSVKVEPEGSSDPAQPNGKAAEGGQVAQA
jgi:uncharacterized membrane protein YfcA